jgi:hypothetical protein
MAELTADSSILDAVQSSPSARDVLYEHGYDLGEGFVDMLSQYQSIRDAARGGRLRDMDGLLQALNRG